MASRPETQIVPVGTLKVLGWFYDNSKDIFLAIHNEVVKKTNPAWTALSGWDTATSEETSCWDYVAAGDLERVQVAFRRLAVGERVEGEFRMRTADDRELWVRGDVVGGEDGWLLVILRDVTAERMREAEREETRRVEGLISADAGVTVWRYNADTDAYEINPDFTRSAKADVATTGQPGEVTRERVHPADAPALNKAWQKTLASGEAGLASYRVLRAGQWRHLRVAWQGARQLPSGRWEVLGIAQDVTELAEARDRALEGERTAIDAVEAKSQFLANISHEIRTPMNGVLGILHLLKVDPPKPERHRLIEEALASGLGFSDLLNDIIDYSDVETGHIELSSEPIDPAQQLEAVIALVKAKADNKGLALRTEVQADVGCVAADPRRLQKMFFHLIGNAVKFTDAGSVDVRLSASGEGEARRLRLEVADTGIGVSLEDQANLFERFRQADGSTTRRFGGVGLGLPVTRRLAPLMGGEAGFTSRTAEGSTFWVEVSAPAATLTVEEDEPGARWLSGVRALVVEDNATNRLVATKMLGILGADVQTADDGAQGVAAVQLADFDVIFMDIQMPVMDGVEATRRIRAMAPPKCDVPIVATTANVMPEQLATYRACGINGVVAKPISPAALLAEVSRIAQGGEEAADRAASA